MVHKNKILEAKPMKKNNPTRIALPHYKTATNTLKAYAVTARLAQIIFGLIIALAMVQIIFAAGTSDFISQAGHYDPSLETDVNVMCVTGMLALTVGGIGFALSRKILFDLRRIISRRIIRKKKIRAKAAAMRRATIRPVDAKALMATVLYGAGPSYEKYCYMMNQ